MKLTKLLASTVLYLYCSSQLPAEDVDSLSREIKNLEGQISSLRTELSTTQATLREVSKLVMTERLELTVHILDNGRYTLEGKGLNDRYLGGKDLDAEKFSQVLKSIIEEYPKPRIMVADREKFVGDAREKLTQLIIRAGIFSISVNPKNNP